MKRSMRYPALLGLLCAFAINGASAQGTITAAPGAFVRGASPFDTTPVADFTGVGTGDQVFETGWWFRVGAATAETAFPAPTTQNYTGATSTITWANPGGAGAFSASETSTITAAAAPNGQVRMDMTITNTSGASLTIALFHFVDLDINGTAGTDNVTQPTAGVPLLRVADATAGFGEYTGHGANAFLVRPFATTTDVAGLLSDTAITNFDNSGVPATSIDMTGGFQWNLTLAAGASQTVSAYFTSNVAAPIPGGGGNTPPVFSYSPAAGGNVPFTGGGAVGSTANASIAVTIGTAGSGTGSTTTTCTAPAGFSGFTQSVTATGAAANTTGGPLTGSCVLGASAVNATMNCSENQGGTPVARTFNLQCPAGSTTSADLSITKTDGVTTVNAGGTAVYTITASNAGPNAANPVTVADTFPASCTAVSWTCVGAGGGTCTASGTGNINQTAVNLPVGGSVTHTATCTISGAATGTLVNTATVSSAVADPNPANNSATDTDTISAATGVLGVLSSTIAFGPQNVGATLQRALTLTNTGTGSLTVNSISAVTPPFAQITGGTCPAATPFALAAGAQCTVLYTFSPTVAGDFSQNVTITSTGGNVTVALTGRGIVSIQLPVGGASSLLLLGLFGLVAVSVLRRR